MKKWIAILAIGLTMMSLSVSADAARRFGGGMSFGRSAPTLQKATPAPSAGINQQQRVNPAQQQQRQQRAQQAFHVRILPFSAPESGAFLFLDGLLYHVFSEKNTQFFVIFMRPVKVSCSPFRVWKNAQKRAIII